jgi:hypothetical protein
MARLRGQRLACAKLLVCLATLVVLVAQAPRAFGSVARQVAEFPNEQLITAPASAGGRLLLSVANLSVRLSGTDLYATNFRSAPSLMSQRLDFSSVSSVSTNGQFAAWAAGPCGPGSFTRPVRRTVIDVHDFATGQTTSLTAPSSLQHEFVNAVNIGPSGRVAALLTGYAMPCSGSGGVRRSDRAAVLSGTAGATRLRVVASAQQNEGDNFAISPDGRTFALCRQDPADSPGASRVTLVLVGTTTRLFIRRLVVHGRRIGGADCFASDAQTATLSYDADAGHTASFATLTRRVHFSTAVHDAARNVQDSTLPSALLTLSPTGQRAFYIAGNGRPFSINLSSGNVRRFPEPRGIGRLILDAVNGPNGNLSPWWVAPDLIIAGLQSPRQESVPRIAFLKPSSGKWSKIQTIKGSRGLSYSICRLDTGRFLITDAADRGFATPDRDALYLTDPSDEHLRPLNTAALGVLHGVSCPTTRAVYVSAGERPARLYRLTAGEINGTTWHR